MNEYEAKQQARKERLEHRAERLGAASDARAGCALQMGSAIPSGQPIMGARDRRYRERMGAHMDKAVELHREAERVASRAEAVGTGGISSDDPDAVQKLKVELAEREARQERMKAINAAHKRFLKNPESLATSGLTEAEQESVRTYKPTFGYDRHPFPACTLTNNNASIRRITQRIALLSRQADVAAAAAATGQPAKTTPCKGFDVIENLAENRVQIKFPSKPAAHVCKLLRRNGFNFSWEALAWQRKFNTHVVWSLVPADGHLRTQLEAALSQL